MTRAVTITRLLSARVNRGLNYSPVPPRFPGGAAARRGQPSRGQAKDAHRPSGCRPCWKAELGGSWTPLQLKSKGQASPRQDQTGFVCVSRRGCEILIAEKV